MRKAIALGALVALTTSGIALALPFKTGQYVSREGGKTVGSITIRSKSFAVKRMAMTETCKHSSRTLTEPVTFVAGTKAKLTGKIDSKGRLSGKYVSPTTASGQSTFAVSGTVKGTRATIKAIETGTFPDTKTTEGLIFRCRGVHTFHFRRSGPLSPPVTGGR